MGWFSKKAPKQSEPPKPSEQPAQDAKPEGAVAKAVRDWKRFLRHQG